MGKVLILTDGKAGHENQSKAFARALGCDYDLVEVHFKSKALKALSYLLDRVGVRTLRLLKVEADSCPLVKDVISISRTSGLETASTFCAVIGTGSGTFYAAKAVAKRLGVKCGVVLYPRGYHLASFDCVLAPAFDRPKKAPNVIEIPANLVANDEAFYEKGVAAFAEKSGFQISDFKSQSSDDGKSKNAIAVIIGGPNKCSTMTPAWMKARLDEIFALRNRTIEQSEQSNNLSFWVTTSRRTPPEVEAVVDSYPWDYKLLYSKDHFNPIPAFVKLAKRLYVTAESTGMLSESCTFGTAEVVALDNLKPGPHKFRRFVEDLRAAGYVDGNRKVDLSAQFAEARRLMGLDGR